MGPPLLVAAVFLEPVQNAGGCLTPPPGYWQEVRSICDRHENRDLKRANEILKDASIFFATKFDGRPKR